MIPTIVQALALRLKYQFHHPINSP
jgi:hypothetical protein